MLSDFKSFLGICDFKTALSLRFKPLGLYVILEFFTAH